MFSRDNRPVMLGRLSLDRGGRRLAAHDQLFNRREMDLDRAGRCEWPV
jgi:hypothetical protein